MTESFLSSSFLLSVVRKIRTTMREQQASGAAGLKPLPIRKTATGDAVVKVPPPPLRDACSLLRVGAPLSHDARPPRRRTYTIDAPPRPETETGGCRARRCTRIPRRTNTWGLAGWA